MKSYEFNIAIWYEKDHREWFYSVIQEVDGEPERLLYGSNPDPKVASAAISECMSELEL